MADHGFVTAKNDDLRNYFSALADILGDVTVTAAKGEPVKAIEAVNWAVSQARKVHDAGNKLIFIGNGGSAAIASHMATDYSKNGGVRSLALNDASMLTCLGNDFGYEHVFAKQVEMHSRQGDILIANQQFRPVPEYYQRCCRRSCQWMHCPDS